MEHTSRVCRWESGWKVKLTMFVGIRAFHFLGKKYSNTVHSGPWSRRIFLVTVHQNLQWEPVSKVLGPILKVFEV